MSTINANSPTEQQYKKPGFLTNAGAVIIGGAATQIPVIPALILIPKIMQKMKGISCLTEDEYTKLSLGVNKTLKESGLATKGLKF
ncbi:MAG: hypothetical protein MZV64_27190 [Ignavibacteriales bacterium]|nr:hypothetical protein [Ignavibacteriales bacterium]